MGFSGHRARTPSQWGFKLSEGEPWPDLRSVTPGQVIGVQHPLRFLPGHVQDLRWRFQSGDQLGRTWSFLIGMGGWISMSMWWEPLHSPHLIWLVVGTLCLVGLRRGLRLASWPRTGRFYLGSLPMSFAAPLQSKHLGGWRIDSAVEEFLKRLHGMVNQALVAHEVLVWFSTHRRVSFAIARAVGGEVTLWGVDVRL
eukprot:jgi/Botrbrau1/23063/Bobra.0243s0005.1